MNRYILTGAPGSGKTAILRLLEMNGFSVVEEAATDLIALRQAEGIAEPWGQAGFVEAVADLQCRRLAGACATEATVQFHDRSIFCTLALADYLSVPRPTAFVHEAERLRREAVYRQRVFFIRNLGFLEPTAARRITFEETLRFERMHEQVYREWGFDLMPIAPAPLPERVHTIVSALECPTR